MMPILKAKGSGLKKFQASGELKSLVVGWSIAIKVVKVGLTYYPDPNHEWD
jgi:hypothetical protein